jgi:hypothetical protein
LVVKVVVEVVVDWYVIWWQGGGDMGYRGHRLPDKLPKYSLFITRKKLIN